MWTAAGSKQREPAGKPNNRPEHSMWVWLGIFLALAVIIAIGCFWPEQSRE